MKMSVYHPIPPLPPLPPIPLPGNDSYGKRIFYPSDKPNMLACIDSDKEIWKVGLSYKDQELEVVFGDLKPDQIMGSIFNKKMNEKLSRSIIIPSRANKMSRNGGEHSDDSPRIMKYSGMLSHDGTLNNYKAQMSGIKNHRFKEYLNKYFPKENVIMQPMAEIMRNILVATGQIEMRKSSNLNSDQNEDDHLSPQPVSMQEKLILETGIVPVKFPNQNTDENGICPTGDQEHTSKLFHLTTVEQDKKKSASQQSKINSEHEKTRSFDATIVNTRNNRKFSFEPKSEYQKQVIDAFSKRKQNIRKKRHENLTLQKKQRELDEENNSTAFEHPSRLLSDMKSFGYRSESNVGKKQVVSVDSRLITPINEFCNKEQNSHSKKRGQKEYENKAMSERPPQVPCTRNMLVGNLKIRPSSQCNRPVYKKNYEDRPRPCRSAERYTNSEALEDRSVKQHQSHKRDRNLDKRFVRLQRSRLSINYDSTSTRSNSYSLLSLPCSRKGSSFNKKRSKERNKMGSPAGDFDDIYKSLRDHVAMAQTHFIYSIMPQLAVAGKIGILPQYNEYKSKNPLCKNIQAIVLDAAFVKKLYKSTIQGDNWSPQLRVPQLVLLPAWERKFLGFRGLNSNKKIVIGCRRSNENWMKTGKL